MLCKSQPTALLLISAALGLGGYTAVLASVCYPAYVPGSTYAVGAWVSKSITTTSPILYTACTPGVSACPPSGFSTEGGNSTTATHNYQCNSNYWCSNVGFAPGSVYSDIAWTKENPACVVSLTWCPTPVLFTFNITLPWKMSPSSLQILLTLSKFTLSNHPGYRNLCLQLRWLLWIHHRTWCALHRWLQIRQGCDDDSHAHAHRHWYFSLVCCYGLCFRR